MYAVIGTGDRQYKVQYDDVIYIEKFTAEQDATVESKVVALGGERDLKVGAPLVEGASVTGKVLKDGKQRKITASIYKPKRSSKRKMGHHRPYTKVQIEAINA